MTGQDRVPHAMQQIKMDSYTDNNRDVQPPSEGDARSSSQVSVIKKAEILVVMEKLQYLLEMKVDLESVDVNLLCEDLCKMNERTLTSERTVNELQAEVAILRNMVKSLADLSHQLDNGLEDAEYQRGRTGWRSPHTSAILSAGLWKH
ncbi:hypothetical protein NDU88_004852 [Pleurodeles waltl]|uniref:Uncharacterized protein n=1 Tax=Pleurodeles waltl TaxID=8319 RepID=A0AAV7TVG4_PLEWA|nr:hypothetical protein NDU88_004852 [Pleurodeles waltl]